MISVYYLKYKEGTVIVIVKSDETGMAISNIHLVGQCVKHAELCVSSMNSRRTRDRSQDFHFREKFSSTRVMETEFLYTM